MPVWFGGFSQGEVDQKVQDAQVAERKKTLAAEAKAKKEEETAASAKRQVTEYQEKERREQEHKLEKQNLKPDPNFQQALSISKENYLLKN